MTRYLVLLIGLPGCGSPDRATPDFSQDSTARQAATQTVSSAAVDAVVARNRPAIVLVEKDRVIWVGDSAGPAMAQAENFLRATRATTDYRIHGKTLELLDSGGHVRMRLEATALR